MLDPRHFFPQLTIHLCSDTDTGEGPSSLTKVNYPNDTDTTGLALVIMPPAPEVVHSILDEVLEYVNEDGIVMVSPLFK